MLIQWFCDEFNGEIIKMFSRSCENKNSIKGGIRNYIKMFSENNVDGKYWYTWHNKINTYKFTFIGFG